MKVTDITTKINNHHIIPRFRCKELGIHPDDPVNDTVKIPQLDHANIHWELFLGITEKLLSYCTPTQFQLDNLCLKDKRHIGGAQLLALGMIEGIDKSGENNPFYGKIHSPESLEKMREFQKNRPPFSEETKKKMSKSGKKRHKDNPFTEETRARLSETHRGEKNYMYGKHQSPETRAKISKANMGNPPTIGFTGKKHSPENIEKFREMNKGENNPMYGITGEDHHRFGVKLSSETIEKIREGNRGKEVSKETRKKLREINKGRRRDRYGRLLPK